MGCVHVKGKGCGAAASRQPEEAGDRRRPASGGAPRAGPNTTWMPLRFSGGRAKAKYLLIHAEASLSRSLYFSVSLCLSLSLFICAFKYYINVSFSSSIQLGSVRTRKAQAKGLLTQSGDPPDVYSYTIASI